MIAKKLQPKSFITALRHMDRNLVIIFNILRNLSCDLWQDCNHVRNERCIAVQTAA